MRLLHIFNGPAKDKRRGQYYCVCSKQRRSLTLDLGFRVHGRRWLTLDLGFRVHRRRSLTLDLGFRVHGRRITKMGRSSCCSKQGLNRGTWTKQEDAILSNYIRVHGNGGWLNLPKKAGINRCGKSCRLRWVQYLRPDIKRGNISHDEEELITRMHRLLGNRWSLIAGRLPGRTDNEIKNYWNTHLKKKLTSMNKSQHKTRPAKSPPRLQNGVIKVTPVKITAVRHHEMVTANFCSNPGNSDNAFKSSNYIQETTNSSESWCGLFVNNSIPGDDSESMADADLLETEADQARQSLHSDDFAGNAGSGLQDFYSGPATLDAEMNEFEHQSNIQHVNSFTLPDDQRMKAFYESREPVDWNHVLNYILM